MNEGSDEHKLYPKTYERRGRLSKQYSSNDNDNEGYISGDEGPARRANVERNRKNVELPPLYVSSVEDQSVVACNSIFQSQSEPKNTDADMFIGDNGKRKLTYEEELNPSIENRDENFEADLEAVDQIEENESDDEMGSEEEKEESDEDTRNELNKVVNRELHLSDIKCGLNTKAAEACMKARYKSLKHRHSPKWLVDLIPQLSAAQRKWVIDTGLAALLNFRVREYPAKLAYQVTKSLDADHNRLTLKSKTLDYTAEDVNVVLGLPFGDEPVIIGGHSKFQKEWQKQFNNLKPSRITPKKIYAKIRSSPEADIWFKWNFLVLMSNLLIMSYTTSYVNKTILGFRGDLDDLSKYDFCEYLLLCLRRTHRLWKANASDAQYQGSVAFTLLLYVDRVDIGKRQMKRYVPTCTGWTYGKLKVRQAAELIFDKFGVGRIKESMADRFDIEKSSTEEDEEIVSVQKGHQDVDAIAKPCNMVDPMSPKLDVHVTTPAHTMQTDICAPEESSAMYDIMDEEAFFKRFERTVDCLEVFYRKYLVKLFQAKGLFPDNPASTNIEERVSDFLALKKCCSGDMDIDNYNLNTPLMETAAEGKPGSILKNVSCSSVSKGKQVTFNISEKESGSTLPIRNLNEELLNYQPSFDIFSPENVSDRVFIEDEYNVRVDRGDPYVLRSSVGNFMDPRPRREIKLSAVKRSPFTVRTVNPKKGRLTETERAIYDWCVNNTEVPEINVFQWGEVKCRNDQMKTLGYRDLVSVTVIDTFTVVLNEEEKFRAVESPYRLFCTAETTMGTLNNIVTKTRVERANDFISNMELICRKYNVNPHKLDMIFFPIHEDVHYYVVCVNLKLLRIEVLDNRRYHNTSTENYQLDIICLRDNVVVYLRHIRHIKSEAIKEVQPVQLTMPWQTVDNSVDCGIFAMRHMETYKRTVVSDWEAGLGYECTNQSTILWLLRGLYSVKILTAEMNEKRKFVSEAAEKKITESRAAAKARE